MHCHIATSESEVDEGVINFRFEKFSVLVFNNQPLQFSECSLDIESKYK